MVVSGEKGTGKTARPAGYMIGGKTGTAETLPRGNHEYVVSFLGYAPIDDPEIAIYVVVDRPNTEQQDDAKFATRIVRKILTEVLPYLNIFMTEELTEKEMEELEELHMQITMQQPGEEEEGEEGETGEEEEPEPESAADTESWKSFPLDPETGYLKEPGTGALFDPETGASVNGDALITSGENDTPVSGVGEPPKVSEEQEDDDFGI